MRKILNRICTLLLVFSMVTGLVPGAALGNLNGLAAHAAETDGNLTLDNGYIRVTLAKNGGFGIRTVDGDKINKSDNDKYLVYEYDEDNTSFTSFQVQRGGETKEYIFGGSYPGSSQVAVSKNDGELTAVWSVDDLTFTQTISLIETGSNEHGTAFISYQVENAGQSAQIKCRILMDTALGYQDYAYYSTGSGIYLENETVLEEDGYEKSFLAVNNTGDPTVQAYTINASIDDEECKPYRTVFAHWNNLASTVFDYTPDPTMYYTNANNVQYLTSDSAFALYFDMGQVAEGGKSQVGTNYGIYSNESVEENATMAVNLNAPDVMKFPVDASGKEDLSGYENGGKFSVKTYIENISANDYTRIKIVVYTTGGIEAIDETGTPVGNTYENPYFIELNSFPAGQQKEMTWDFQVSPKENGQYAKVHYKVYDVSAGATQNTGALMAQNLLGEGSCYILCPGTVEKVPAIKFTGSSPETVYTAGTRNLFVTGDNFSILEGEQAAGTFALKLRRVDGYAIHGQQEVILPNDQVKIDSSTNVMTVILGDDVPGELAEGMYQLAVDYADTSKEDISGQALRFQVSSDQKYKNDAYGFLAVMKDDYSGYSYSIRHFASAEEYWLELEEGRVKREEVLLEFQGSFIKEKDTGDGKIVYTGVSLSDTDNIMTLNGCLDIRDGTVTVTEEKGSVTVDFDADLYTTGSGTAVWSGMCALTELEKGTNYELVPYNENGDRQKMEGETITLLWPSVGQGFQSLAGLLFELKYGELGTITHPNAPSVQGGETRVVAFGAAMDLSFLIPESISNNIVLGGKTKYTKDALGSSWDAAEHNSIKWTPAEIRALNKQADYRLQTAKTDATENDVASGRLTDMTIDDTPGYNAASIVIDDILFGGEYLGVNMAVGLGIPNYIDGLPAVEGLLTIRTVGDWSFGVEGQCHFLSFNMEAGVEILSKNDIPIPNKLSFFVGGIKPGINVDGVGVLWLQGAGGGIENLYDTIFLTDSVPPLKLIIKAQFSILQVFTATASLGLSLRGIEVNIGNGVFTDKIDNPESGTTTEFRPVVLDAAVQVDWYPEFFMLGAVNADLATIIQGGGYVVADAKGFYEFFLRAAVSVPSDIPIVGGITIAEVNLGVNDTKVWGQAAALGVPVGVCYYWNGGVDWNSGSGVYPTYPELVGMDTGGIATFAIDHNEATGEVLYMELGTNARLSASTMGLRDSSPDIQDELVTDISTASMHTLKLTENGSAKLLVIQWSAESLEQANQDVRENILIYDSNQINSEYPVKLLDNTKSADSVANAGANANLTYDEATKTASLAISFTKMTAPGVYDTKWTIQTPEGAALVVYDMAPLPELTVSSDDVTLDTASNQLTVALSGTKLEEFDHLTLIAEANGSGKTALLGRVENPVLSGGTSLTIDIPAAFASGEYTLRICASDDEGQHYSEADASLTYSNPNQPAALTADTLTAANAGDYQVAVTIQDSGAGSIDGYAFTAYDKDGNPVPGVTDVLLYKDGTAIAFRDDGTIAPGSGSSVQAFTIGGRYSSFDPEKGTAATVGMSAGDYTIQVRRWKRMDDGAGILTSDPVEVKLTVREPLNSEVIVTATTADGKASSTMKVAAKDGSEYTLPVFAGKDVNLTLTASDSTTITGTWRLDGGTREGTHAEVAASTDQIRLSFTDLDNGTHYLHFLGKNQYGDSVSASYRFVVDTIGPRLMLSEPVNGGLFDYWTGDMAVSGVTDRDALLTIVDNTTGKTLLHNVRASELMDSTGSFATTITLDRAILEHELTITVKDDLGNATEKTVTVMSNGLGSIEKLLIFSGSKDVTNTKLTAGGSYPLQLVAKLKRPADADQQTEDLYVVINRAGMVDWMQTVEEGESEIQDRPDGIQLNTSAGSEGMITARFLVNDAGAYTVSAAFGYTGEQIRTLDSEHVQLRVQDQLYTGKPVTTKAEVWYDGVKLVEGTDYELVDYTNNTEVTTETSKATVQIRGLGLYTGQLTGKFSISYLPLDASFYSLSGEKKGDVYTTDVQIVPKSGYETVIDGQAANIILSKDGTNAVQFRIRRVEDGAMTDLISLVVQIDKDAGQKTYSFLSGNGQTWTKNSGKTMRFQVNGSKSSFTGIVIDGKLVDEKNYTVDANMTVTLKAEYLQTLSVGKHSLNVLFADGEAAGSFQVVKPQVTPPTGDESGIVLWTMLMVFSAAAVLALFEKKRRAAIR